MKRVIITGVTGQDGFILANKLHSQGVKVLGISRSAESPDARSETVKTPYEIRRERSLVQGVQSAIREYQPAEIYHYAADSFIPNGWECPTENMSANYELTISILEAIRKFSPQTRLLNACSREVYGSTVVRKVSEDTRLSPQTPYGINKAASMWLVRAYRERYGLFACNAILFNHESPVRPEHFVSRKVSKRVAEIKLGIHDTLELGDLTAERDWGFAGDFVDAMVLMISHDSPEDFVLGTGQLHSLKEFVELAFSHVNLEWQQYVKSVRTLVRASDTTGCAANISKATEILNWRPKVSFSQLVEMMVDADIERLESKAEKKVA